MENPIHLQEGLTTQRRLVTFPISHLQLRSARRLRLYLLLHRKICQNLLAPSSDNKYPDMSTDLLDPGALSTPRVSKPAQNLLRLPIRTLQCSARQDFTVCRQAAYNKELIVDLGALDHIHELFHVCVGWVD
jgi:hypothetical protein